MWWLCHAIQDYQLQYHVRRGDPITGQGNGIDAGGRLSINGKSDQQEKPFSSIRSRNSYLRLAAAQTARNRMLLVFHQRSECGGEHQTPSAIAHGASCYIHKHSQKRKSSRSLIEDTLPQNNVAKKGGSNVQSRPLLINKLLSAEDLWRCALVNVHK